MLPASWNREWSAALGEKKESRELEFCAYIYTQERRPLQQQLRSIPLISICFAEAASFYIDSQQCSRNLFAKKQEKKRKREHGAGLTKKCDNDYCTNNTEQQQG